MKINKLNIFSSSLLLAILLVFIAGSGPAFAQDPDFYPDRDKAEQAFSKGDYAAALKHYRVLLDRFSADPVYMYFTGACLVETGQDFDGAAKLLKEAILNSSPMRTVPDKAWYYLGRAYQLGGDFEKAVDAYETYRGLVRRREARQLDIERLIDESRRRTGDAVTAGRQEKEPAEEKVSQDDLATGEKEKLSAREQTGDKKPDERERNKYAKAAEGDSTGIGTEKQQEPGEEYERLAREALEYQFKADSVQRLAGRYRSNLDEVPEEDKQSVISKILSLEQTGFEYQSMADKKYREAAGLAFEKYDNKIPERQQEPGKVQPPLTGHGKDSTASGSGEKKPGTSLSRPDSMEKDSLVQIVRKPEPVLELFSEHYGQINAIPLNPELPDGLFYRIQVAAFRNPRELSFFKGLGPVSISRAEGSDVNIYYVGMFRSLDNAREALVKVRQKGFSDAFIVAMMDGERIRMEEAEKMEGNWSRRSLFSQDTVVAPPDSSVATAPTLTYRVQAMKVENKIEDVDLELLDRLSAHRSYDVFKTGDREFVYLIGKFLTFESAAAYADLLFRNGLTDAKVVAYLGKKEISLETARKLFEMDPEK